MHVEKTSVSENHTQLLLGEDTPFLEPSMASDGHPGLTQEMFDIMKNNASCNKAWKVSVKEHVVKQTGERLDTPMCCGERNCCLCYKTRVNKTKVRLLPLWKSLRPGLKTGHIIITFGEIPLELMTYEKYLDMRKKLRAFFKRLRRRPENVWGFGAFELKWRERRAVFTPHVHLVAFGYLPDAKIMQKMWSEINGKYLKVQTEYGRKPSEFRSVQEYYFYLNRRRMGMLDYLARRSAGMGIVTGKVKKDEKMVEIGLSSIPLNVYANVVKRSRSLIPFGKLYKYKNADGEWKRTNVPLGILHTWQQRVQEEALKKLEYEVILIGYIQSPSQFTSGDAPPPQHTPSYEEIKAKFVELGYSEDPYMEKELGYSLAYQELVRLREKYGVNKDGTTKGSECKKVKKIMIDGSTLEEVRSRHKSVHQGDSWNHITYEESL